jgi:hypothetical protein
MAHRIICSVSCCNMLLKKGIGCPVIRQVLRKRCQNVCVIYQCEYMVLEKKLGPLILVAFIVYHKTTLTSRNRTSGLILQTCYSESSYIHWNTIKFHQWTEWMCGIFLHYALYEDNQFTIFSFSPSSVLLSSWTFSHICKLFSCFELANQETFISVYNDTSYRNCI